MGVLTQGLSRGCMEERGHPGCKRHLVAACGLRLRGAVLLPEPPVPHRVCAGPAAAVPAVLCSGCSQEVCGAGRRLDVLGVALSPAGAALTGHGSV